MSARSRCPFGRPARLASVVELRASVLPLALPLTAVVVVVAVLMLLLLPVIVAPPGRKMSISLIAVAVALLVLLLVELALGALVLLAGDVGVEVGVWLPEPLTAAFVVVAGDVDVLFPAPLTTTLLLVEGGIVPAPLVVPDGLVVLAGVVALCAGALVPLAAVPDPLTVDALMVVDPDVFTSPEPLLFALTVVDPEALVVARVGLVVVGALVVLRLLSSTGAAVPLAASPEPLTVAAFTVVEPAAFTMPEPLFVAFTVVEPVAFVTAVCAYPAALPSPSSAALTAVATRRLRCCDVLIVMSLLSVATGDELPEGSRRLTRSPRRP